MKKKHVKLISGIIVAVIVILIIFAVINRPTYPDITSPKDFRGNPDAAIHIVEYSDLQCPACRRAHPVVKQVVAAYENDVRLEFRHFPLTSIHPMAHLASQAAECANDQGKFWDYVDIVYLNQQQLSKSNLKKWAADLGLDETFNDCLESGAKKDLVNMESRQGVLDNVRGTPTIFINGQELGDWSFDNFQKEIEKLLG